MIPLLTGGYALTGGGILTAEKRGAKSENVS